MATSLTVPAAIGQPFANHGDKATLPESTSAKIASLSAGFPLSTSLLIASGGAYPRRSDMNALGFLVTSFQFFMQNGGVMAYSSDVSTAIGGYPAGARLWATIGGETVIARSLVNNNELDPATNIDDVNWTVDLPFNTASLLADNGYQILPSGLIMQWGTVTSTSSSVVVTFPLEFPNAVLNVVLSDECENATGGHGQTAGIYNRSQSVTGFTLSTQNGIQTFWQAIGY